MNTITVANSTLTFTGERRNYESGGHSGTAEIVEIATPDGLKAEISIIRFDSGEIHIRLTEFLSTPPPIYAHLTRNGTMTVQVREDGKWVALLRALRPGGRDHATLNNITWAELDDLLGSDTILWLQAQEFEVGTWSELNPKAARFKESLAIAVQAEKAHLLILPWMLTRVIALMKKLGKPSIVDIK